MLSVKKEGKEMKTFLSDDFQKLSFYEGVNDPNAIFHSKDIGTQINYRLVYILEYLGPLLFTLFFFFRYYFIFKKNNPEKELQVHVICYFLMSILHYSKRIYESIFVHIFSRTTMPFSNLFKNCAYYWGIFGILCGYSLFNPYGNDLTFMKVPRYFFILFFISGEIANYRTHMILRDIKLNKEGKKDIPPLIEGFEWVTCANYLWEFLTWVSFSVFSLNIFVFFFTICGFLQMKQWALKKHAEMKKTHGENYKIKYSFIPYIV
jgi:very-long-chain enoyl-CoA reductase